MTAHIRLVSPPGEERRDLEGEGAEADEAPLGLPEESRSQAADAHAKTGSRGAGEDDRQGDWILGDAPPPLVAEPEDRAGRRPGPKTVLGGVLARLIDRARPQKRKGATAAAEPANPDSSPEGDKTEARERTEDAGTRADALPAVETGSEDGPGLPPEPIARLDAGMGPLLGRVSRRKPKAATAPNTVANLTGGLEGDAPESGVEGAAAPDKPARPRGVGKGTVAVVLVTVAAAAAIVALNWPHGSRRPQIVEPGLIADQPSKLMAPSAALATVPPREEPNVAGERPRVHQARRDQVEEMLSFKPGSATAGASRDARGPQPLLASAPEKATSSSSAAAAPAPTPAAAPAPDRKPDEVASLPPAAPLLALAPLARLAAEGAPEPGLGEAAKIEARLADLEAAIKARANAPATRTDIDKAETQMSDQVARLAAIVTRLTGQVKDLQEQVRTTSAGSEERLADLTRRVSLAESRSAVAAAESAGAVPAGVPTSGAPAAAPSSGAAGQAQGVRMKVAALDQKRAYRIQAASPGLAMLSVVDGAPDDRPVEVAIGTVLPGYGKVISIEQHGQAWVVKADRGSIQ
ncbi:hypothetical protein DFR50_11292 [Roseiarcus fermentans]|uniref:Uncharacterized protein n=1 Tax=Roseiarcus fermentans TaxID=1473586 RepID=A0A366FEM0_9HYPH|nr:hypothetical protein [Roseiarcus fermentans]RBP13123.1 hypothetical protein DFR50_11292 [Roseiarcus fermentans]